ncbi:MAG TPA: hypothetical protein VKR58_02640 [Aquella sp.]|nr:hypothetical protein [Aquella sp.]
MIKPEDVKVGAVLELLPGARWIAKDDLAIVSNDRTCIVINIDGQTTTLIHLMSGKESRGFITTNHLEKFNLITTPNEPIKEIDQLTSIKSFNRISFL